MSGKILLAFLLCFIPQSLAKPDNEDGDNSQLLKLTYSNQLTN
jgi:hypothetical protein